MLNFVMGNNMRVQKHIYMQINQFGETEIIFK